MSSNNISRSEGEYISLSSLKHIIVYYMKINVFSDIYFLFVGIIRLMFHNLPIRDQVGAYMYALASQISGMPSSFQFMVLTLQSVAKIIPEVAPGTLLILAHIFRTIVLLLFLLLCLGVRVFICLFLGTHHSVFALNVP